MNHQDEIESMKRWCMDNYENGASTMVECWADSDYAELFDGVSVHGAWRILKATVSVYRDREADAINSAF
jgi:hypothetical protein